MKLVLKERGFDVPSEYQEKAALLADEASKVSRGLASGISTPSGAVHQAEVRSKLMILSHCGDKFLIEVVKTLGLEKNDYASWEFSLGGKVLIGRRYEFQED